MAQQDDSTARVVGDLLTDDVGDEEEDIFRVRLGGCQIHSNFGIDVSERVLPAGCAGVVGAVGRAVRGSAHRCGKETGGVDGEEMTRLKNTATRFVNKITSAMRYGYTSTTPSSTAGRPFPRVMHPHSDADSGPDNNQGDKEAYPSHPSSSQCVFYRIAQPVDSG